MSDLELFESPKLLLSGAKENINDFESQCAMFIKNCTHRVIDYIEPKTGDKIIKFRFDQRIPPKLNFLASHIINDLRHALDQAFGDGAILLGRENSKNMFFPIGKSLDDFQRQRNDKCKRVHIELLSFIDGIKPYNGGDTLLYEFLRIAGPNKHQRVIRISFAQAGLQVLPATNLFIPAGSARPMKLDRWNDLRNELEFMRFGKGAFGQIDAIPTVQIVLREGEPPLAGPAASLFHTCAGKIEGIILGIEAECRRIHNA